jgi:hypothetical protein
MRYFQHILKSQLSVKESENQAPNALQALLAQIPAFKLKILRIESAASESGIDLTARIEVSGHPGVCLAQNQRSVMTIQAGRGNDTCVERFLTVLDRLSAFS